VVSGRRKHPVTPPPGGLAALAGRLGDLDWRVCRLLADHQVLTTGLLVLLLGVPARTLQQRLALLTTLRVVERFRPHRPVGAGSAPFHYLLGEAGAAILAANGHLEGLGRDRERLLGVAHANGRLSHLLAVNTLAAQLTDAARQQPGTRLVCWWPAHRCQAQWGRLIAADAYARWQDPDGEVDFFLHQTPTHPTADQARLLLDGYNQLAAATGITTPVLLHASDPDGEAQLRQRLAGARLLVPVATSNPACGPPTQGVWLPTSSPAGGRRYRLGALGHPDPWHPSPPAGAATPAPDTAAAPPQSALVEDPAGWR
jgi:Replication-relaxation